MIQSKESVLALIEACSQGNIEAIKEFFEIYSKDIYNFPIKVFHLTEDDASDFFIYAFERLKSGKRLQSFQGKSSFKTWLYTVLRNMLIDWKRNKKELKIVSTAKINTDGVEYSTIDNEPDTRIEEKKQATTFTDQFYTILNSIKVENRVVFKLAYVYYLNLEKDEIEYILEKNQISLSELEKKILEIRDFLSEKEEEKVKNEDKITSIYLSILELKENLIKEGPIVFKDNLPYEDKAELALKKKYEQRKKLIDRKNRGHFLTRTPYKIISEILNIPEGGVSISLQRVTEKIKKKFDDV